MFRVFLLALLTTALLLPASCVRAEKEPLALRDFSEVENLFYKNPHLSGVADPFIFSADGVYYMVATTGGENFVGYKTDTLAKWAPSARFTAMRPAPWAGSDHWAQFDLNFLANALRHLLILAQFHYMFQLKYLQKHTHSDYYYF